MKNLKDFVTTTCGILIAVCGAVVIAVHSGLVILSEPMVNASTLIVIVATAVSSYFNGKNPDGSRKTPSQIAAQLNHKDESGA